MLICTQHFCAILVPTVRSYSGYYGGLLLLEYSAPGLCPQEFESPSHLVPIFWYWRPFLSRLVLPSLLAFAAFFLPPQLCTLTIDGAASPPVHPAPLNGVLTPLWLRRPPTCEGPPLLRCSASNPAMPAGLRLFTVERARSSCHRRVLLEHDPVIQSSTTGKSYTS